MLTCLVWSVAQILAGSGSPPSANSTAGGLVWVYPAGLSASSVVLGDRGGQVLVRNASTELKLLSAYDSDPPRPLWRTWSDGNEVAARDADTYLTTGYVDEGGPGSWKVVLHKRTSSSPVPDWSFEFGPQMFVFLFYGISRDGRAIVSGFFDEATLRTGIRVHDPATGAPTRSFALPAGIGIGRIAVSPDGSMAAISDGNHSTALTHVIDLASESIVFSTPGYLPRTQGLSEEGRVLLVQEKRGTDWHLRTLVRGAGGYQDTVDSSFPYAQFPNPCALSDDGSTAAVAWFESASPNRFTVRAFDVASGAMTMERVILGPGPENYFSSIAISSDGSRFVVGYGGDGPGLAVYSPEQSAPLVEDTAGGLVQAVDISPDGDRFVASRMPVNGPSYSDIELYEFGGEDLVVHGRPSIGATIAIDVHATPGASAFLLWSRRIAADPLVLPGGTLFLGRTGLTTSPIGVVPSSGVATYPLGIAYDPALVGRTSYYQGLTTGPRSLTRDWVQLTILP